MLDKPGIYFYYVKTFAGEWSPRLSIRPVEEMSKETRPFAFTKSRFIELDSKDAEWPTLSECVEKYPAPKAETI